MAAVVETISNSGKNQCVLKDSVKREGSVEFRDRSIVVQPEMPHDPCVRSSAPLLCRMVCRRGTSRIPGGACISPVRNAADLEEEGAAAGGPSEASVQYVGCSVARSSRRNSGWTTAGSARNVRWCGAIGPSSAEWRRSTNAAMIGYLVSATAGSRDVSEQVSNRQSEARALKHQLAAAARLSAVTSSFASGPADAGFCPVMRRPSTTT